MSQHPAAFRPRRNPGLLLGVFVGLGNIVFSIWLGTHRGTLWAYEDYAGLQSFVGAGLGAATALVCGILYLRGARPEPIPPAVEPIALFENPTEEDLDA